MISSWNRKIFDLQKITIIILSSDRKKGPRFDQPLSGRVIKGISSIEARTLHYETAQCQPNHILEKLEISVKVIDAIKNVFITAL